MRLTRSMCNVAQWVSQDPDLDPNTAAWWRSAQSGRDAVMRRCEREYQQHRRRPGDKRITDILVDALRDRDLHATEVTRAMGEVQLCPKHRRHRPP